MEVDAFERVYEAFGDFHAFIAPGLRPQTVAGAQRALSPGPAGPIPGAAQRREFAEMVPVSARALQRFLTEARWDDDAVIARLQEYLGPRLEHPLAVWVFDGSDFPKQGVKSVGVTRQYCGALGKVANCQAGVFLAHVGPRGRALVDKRLYLPESWTSDPARCATAGVPEAQRRYRGEARPGPGDAAPSPGTGVPQRRVGCGGRRVRDVPGVPRRSDGRGDAVRLGRSAGHPSLAAGAYLEQTGLPRTRAPSPAQATAPGASERRGAQPGAAQGGVARGHGGGGSAGAADIPVQR